MSKLSDAIKTAKGEKKEENTPKSKIQEAIDIAKKANKE